MRTTGSTSSPATSTKRFTRVRKVHSEGPVGLVDLDRQGVFHPEVSDHQKVSGRQKVLDHQKDLDHQIRVRGQIEAHVNHDADLEGLEARPVTAAWISIR